MFSYVWAVKFRCNRFRIHCIIEVDEIAWIWMRFYTTNILLTKMVSADDANEANEAGEAERRWRWWSWCRCSDDEGVVERDVAVIVAAVPLAYKTIIALLMLFYPSSWLITAMLTDCWCDVLLYTDITTIIGCSCLFVRSYRLSVSFILYASWKIDPFYYYAYSGYLELRAHSIVYRN